MNVPRHLNTFFFADILHFTEVFILVNSLFIKFTIFFQGFIVTVICNKYYCVNFVYNCHACNMLQLVIAMMVMSMQRDFPYSLSSCSLGKKLKP